MKAFSFISLAIALGISQAVQAQTTVTGYLSIKSSAGAATCGCTGCNDATTDASAQVPDPSGFGVCRGESASGNCSTTTRNISIFVPDGCGVTAQAYFGDRTGCTGTSNGPGMDSGDSFSIVGSGGTSNGNSGTITGASNSSQTASITQVGGQIKFTLTANRISELLTYTISYSGSAACRPSPLPVELVQFSVAQYEHEFLLSWATASERNSRDYGIEYSDDGLNFRKVQSVPAMGNTTSLHHYNATVTDEFRTLMVYFRLRQNDNDGSYSHSPIVAVERDAGTLFSVSPNPSPTGYITVRPGKYMPADSYMDILDATGKTLMQTTLTEPLSTFYLGDYGKGLYLLRVYTSGKVITRKIILD